MVVWQYDGNFITLRGAGRLLRFDERNGSVSDASQDIAVGTVGDAVTATGTHAGQRSVACCELYSWCSDVRQDACRTSEWHVPSTALYR
jgi:hypothetical protein